MADLNVDSSFAERSVNEGFSGGERKRHEILQMGLLNPKFAVLDETDSGLDVDALKVVSEGVNRVRAGGEVGVVLITHTTRLLRQIPVEFVHVMWQGRIVAEGGPELADEIEANGYEQFIGRVSPDDSAGRRHIAQGFPDPERSVRGDRRLVYLDSGRHRRSRTPSSTLSGISTNCTTLQFTGATINWPRKPRMPTSRRAPRWRASSVRRPTRSSSRVTRLGR